MLISACVFQKSGELVREPPPTPILSRQFVGYGVVTASYTHLLNAPRPDSVSLGYLRRGAVVEISERRITAPGGGGQKTWLQVRGAYTGWLPEEVVDIYPSAAQAHTAAALLGTGL